MTDRVICKSVAAVVSKTAGGFEARVSTFGNVDVQGDVVLPGAFDRTIEEWGDRPVPVVWSHQTWDPEAFIGKATIEAREDGLYVTAEYLDTERAQHVRDLMDSGLVVEFSWSGRVREGEMVKVDEDTWAFGLKDIDLWEVGPTFKGANPDTELLGVKALSARLTTKEGRVLAQRHVDTLRGIQEQLGGVLDAVESKSAGDDPPTDDGAPPGAPDPGDASGEPTTKTASDDTSGAAVISNRTRAIFALI
ncbi:HK97 family phage prohead protease [Isoptericola dokdonensis]|uniref:Caudovirus prohead protease n=1 Tax=Isoptericola dokdonensis DS-3 TaxID=1300344 RepID=A0A161IDV2_9MICO|nr:HK97 family phage prohead protease [Isoptericola dokdonensis]ANC31437.1 Caudovirus prohead protease [Isoptericola dokdonensis DS-3]